MGAAQVGEAGVVSIGIGSKRWADQIRKRARDLSKQLDEGYVELAVLLHNVYHVPVDGDRRREAVFRAWGYKSFTQYAEEELNLKRRKADYLRSIGTLLEVNLAGVDPDLRKRLVALGWGKLRELSRLFFNKSDASYVSSWISKCEKMNFPQVQEAVGNALDRMGIRDGEVVEDITEDEEVVDEDSSDEEDSEESGGEDVEDGDAPSEKKGNGRAKKERLPDPVREKVFTFVCFDEQIDNVVAALDRAEEMIQQKGGMERSKSGRLSLICLDFLATNDFGKKGDPEQMKRYLHKMEVTMGMKLVAVKDDEVIYGLRTLKKLAE
jgi:hypothetical protein